MLALGLFLGTGAIITALLLLVVALNLLLAWLYGRWDRRYPPS